MLTENTVTKLQEMHLSAMAKAFMPVAPRSMTLWCSVM